MTDISQCIQCGEAFVDFFNFFVRQHVADLVNQDVKDYLMFAHQKD
jgi:hypothetical protein